MGHSYKRIGSDGRPRYTAVYHDARGERRSAGSFGVKRDADKAWQKAEARIAEGHLGDPSRGRVSFRDYVERVWLPNHQIELTTRQRYTTTINKRLMPEFGSVRMIDILPAQVRSWVTRLSDDGVSPSTIAASKTILSAIFTTALNDQVVFLHPCRGVKTPPVAKKPRVIVTPEQFETIYEAIGSNQDRLLVETAIETGLRWGELVELHPADLALTSRMLTVSRTVVELVPAAYTQGERFTIKQYPKNQSNRRIRLSAQLATKLGAHIAEHKVAVDQLLFRWRDPGRPSGAGPDNADPELLGRTEPNTKGRRYQHGTTTAYSLGGCRCEHCRHAFAQYRQRRRAAGFDQPRTRRLPDTDGHISRSWFRTNVWLPALRSAGLDFPVRFHDLRHAHASWLLAGGADLQVVKERLGHGSLRTTERYLHTLPDSDETALDALNKIRSRPSR
jgi:integrase